MFKKTLDWCFGLFGYYRPEIANELVEEYREIIHNYYYQNSALLDALGAAEQRTQSDNVIKVCLMVLLNKEKIEMKLPFINEVADMNMVINSTVNENNDIVLTLVENEIEDEPTFLKD